MAVYTKLTKEEIQNYLKNYQIGQLLEYSEIVTGIDNSNFLLKTNQGKFILTIFEARIKENELPFFINFKLHLAKKAICCPKPIINNSGEIIGNLKNKKASIVSFLEGSVLQPNINGYYTNITAKHCFEIGKILAKLHLAALDFKSNRFNDLGNLAWDSFFKKFENLADNFQENLKVEILDNLVFLKKNWRNNLPSCACHLDLFPDNVFFDNNLNINGVIDFYFAANDFMIYDFAIVVNSWCFDENNIFIQEKFDEVLRGYESVRKFSQIEKDFLKTACLGAAMRFVLTRLHDWFFTPKNSLVKIKNPQEYLTKLRFFRSQI